MSSILEKRKIELSLCQYVAKQWNEIEDSDYSAEASAKDPPDCLLTSSSGKFETREIEVTTASADYTLRVDNNNLLRACRNLESELSARGLNGRSVRLDLSEKGLRNGLKPRDIDRLSDMVCAEFEKRKSADIAISDVQIWKCSPELSDLVCGVEAYQSATQSSTNVTPCLSTFMSDWSCIPDAIESKTKKYQSSARRFDLVVGCPWYLEGKEIQSLRQKIDTQSLPYRTVWLVSDFDGVFKLK